MKEVYVVLKGESNEGAYIDRVFESVQDAILYVEENLSHDWVRDLYAEMIWESPLGIDFVKVQRWDVQ